MTTTSKLILGSAIFCALLAGCKKHEETVTTPPATIVTPATPATPPADTMPAPAPATPPADATTPPPAGTTNPDGTTTPPPPPAS